MDQQNKHQSSFIPFWQPWGAGGCLWRTIVFLLGLALICLLLSLLKHPDGKSGEAKDPTEWTNPFRSPGKGRSRDPYRDMREILDSSRVREWIDSIPGVPELPDPDDNFIPPVDSSKFIVDPTDSTRQIVCDQLTVFFNSSDLKRDMAAFARRFKQLYPGAGYKVTYYNPVAGTMLLAVPEDRLIQVADDLPRQIPEIDFIISTNEIFRECAKPSDPGFRQEKYDAYFKLIQAYEAWDITKGDPNVKVAIMDSYFDLTNPEIGDRYVDPIYIPTKSRNVLPPPAAPTEADITSYCHGSHVAGIAIGAQGNNLACSGIAPECTWIPISLGNQLTSFNIMEGLLYAVYSGADVVNFSLGRSFPENIGGMPLDDQVEIATTTDKRGEKLWEYIIKTANDHNCVLVTSAGNDSVLMGLDPKNRSMQMIKVEAVDSQGQKAPFSNFGEVPEAAVAFSTVSAPGVDIWSVSEKRCAPLWRSIGYVVSPQDGLQEMSGTSMAAPVVAGAVALLKSKNKNLTTEQVIKILRMTGKQFDTRNRIGPTIQIKDALDATGGDLANFDDLMKDHDLLIGKWRSTHELIISREEGGVQQKIDDIWTYFIFTSSTEGHIEHHTIASKKVYSARVRVRWGSDKIEIDELEQAVTPDGDKLSLNKYRCTPDADRLLNATCIKVNKKDETFDFQLEKVN